MEDAARWIHPETVDPLAQEHTEERLRCRQSAGHFISAHVKIYDATPGVSDWIPFRLWPAQEETLRVLQTEKRIVELKARQLGQSWLKLAYILWLMLFRPAATALIFSKRDDEAVELLDFRLKGMHDRLPPWLREASGTERSHTDAKHQWLLRNGSRALAFPTTGGRSYTATVAFVDEADYIADLKALLNAVKPTTDAGGQLILLSSTDKSKPQSEFKRIYLAAKAGQNSYHPLFWPWSARPDRDAAWYEEQRRDVLAKSGALDDLHQEYPETDVQALAPNTLDKRIPSDWLSQCYEERSPLRLWSPVGSGGNRQRAGRVASAPPIPTLRVYRIPRRGGEYRVGVDPAEGNPTSDDSSLTVVDKMTGEEVCALAGKYEPTVFASYVADIARWYNRAQYLVERNNHGHAVLAWLRDNARDLHCLDGTDQRPGWLTTSASKATLYSTAADAFRQGDTLIHSFSAYVQLASIEGASLSAPQGEHDDRAISYVLALKARAQRTHIWTAA